MYKFLRFIYETAVSYVTTLVLLMAVSPAHAATFNLFSPASGVLKGTPTSYVTTAATSADILAMWSGTCSGATALLGNGACGTLTSGTVTSVAMTVPSFLSISGSPITASGTLAVSLSGTALPATSGGLGMTTVTDDTVAVANGTTWESKALPNCTDTGGNHINYTASTNTWSCGTSGAGSVANPTATIGLTAVNGSASTAMRSDGAPALNQSIAPTWTGLHTFASPAATSQQSVTFSGSTTAANRVRMTNTGANLLWGVENSSGGGLLVGSPAYGSFIASDNATTLSLGTNSTERVRISSTGNVTINAPSSGTGLTVSGASASDPGLNIAAGTLAIAGAEGSAGQVLTSNGGSAMPSWNSTAANIISGGSVSTNGSGACALTTNATIGLASCSVSTSVLTITFSNAAAHYWLCSAANEGTTQPYVLNSNRNSTTTSEIRALQLTATGPITWAAVNLATTAATFAVTCQPL